MGHGARAGVFVALLGSVTGCATRTPAADFDDVRRMTTEREAKDVRWEGPARVSPEARASANAALARGISADEAVEVALLLNRSLQAEFEEVGIAQTDLWQAGLLRNPVLHAAAQFTTGGEAGVRLEYSVVGFVIDALRAPSRRRKAGADLEIATYRAADAVLALAHDVRVAWWRLAAAQRAGRLLGEEVDLLEAADDLSREQQKVGNVPEIDRMAREDALLEARLDRLTARADVREAGERLARLLGVDSPPDEWRLTADLPDPPGAEPPFDALEATALAKRLDLEVARGEIRSIRLGSPAARLAAFSDSGAGLSGEREPGGAHHVGPEVAVALPLFDTGAAATTRAAFRLRQAEDRLAALEVAARSEVRAARERLLAAREIALQHRDARLPRRRRATALVQERYDAMVEGPYRLIEAKRAEYEAERRTAEALRDYWTARADLERALGTRLPAPPTVSQPAAPPAATPATPAKPVEPAPAAPPPSEGHGEHGGHRHGG